MLYSPSPLVKEPLKSQIKKRNYPDLDPSDVEVVEEYEEELGPGVCHALLAAGSGEELKAVAYALRKFSSLHLHEIGTGRSSQNDKPQTAILFGEIEPGVPMTAALQANYLYQQSDHGPPSSTDLLLCGLYCSPKWGLRPIKPTLMEFDFHSKYGRRRQTLKDRDKDRGEAIRGLETHHVEKKEGYTEDWDKAWRKQTDEYVKAFAQNASRVMKERASEGGGQAKTFERRDLSELPVIHRFEDIDPGRFRDIARAYSFQSYRSIVSEDAEETLRLRVTRDSVHLGELHPTPESIREAFSDKLRGSVISSPRSDVPEDGGKDNA